MLSTKTTQRLAINALSQYAFDITDIQLLGVYSNTLFRVYTVDSSSYLLRICTPSWRTDVDMLSEIAWLQALNRDTGIGVPQPQPARDGEFIVEACAEGTSETRQCILTSWIPGTSMGTQLTETNLFKMGVLFARLHAHAADFSPPKDFTRRKMDTLYVCGERDVLLSVACRDAFTPQTRDVFTRTRAKVDAAFERLHTDPAGLRVIHNDLHHNNIKVHRGRLHPFDFDFTMWGYPVQDLAVAIQGLMLARPDAFEPLQNALREGYESREKWPESYMGQIDTFRAGRMLWAANYIAQFDRGRLSAYVEALAPQLVQFLETSLLGKSRAMRE